MRPVVPLALVSDREPAGELGRGVLQEIVHGAGEAILVVDADLNARLLNASAERLFDCSAHEALGRSVERFIPHVLHKALHHKVRESAALPARSTEAAPTEVSGVHADGRKYALEMQVVRLKAGGRPLYSVLFNDVSARRHDQARLNLLVNFDPLTSLPNRALFQQRLQSALARAGRFNKLLAVLFIDLDRFKNINDTLGHAAGDRVLQAVAAQLARSLREVDTLARLGGDEFAVLIEEMSDTRVAATVARKLIRAVAAPFELDAEEYRVTASIGVSVCPADGRDAATLVKNAEIAMYRAKEHGRNTLQFYAPAMNAHSSARLALETGMRHALERGEFVLHYQPQAELATGRVTGLEALVRWKRPGIGLVPPGAFIPIAEETGLVVAIDEWTLKAACAQGALWQRDGLPALRIAVNVSARQFARPSLVGDVARVLDTSGRDPGSLELEITESMVMEDPERAIRTLRQLKAMGVRLALDDFGTGYSSLGTLKRFPIDSIKIDRAFVKDIPGSADDRIITRTIIAMSRSLRLRSIAEGVETQAQQDFLREHGCDEMQGYHFSRPLPAGELRALLERSRAEDRP